jgi:hypothetical protein
MGKDITIVVNGRAKEVAKEDMTFNEIVALADGLPTGQFIVYTITYRRGHGNKPEGTLVEGEPVKVKDGMIFNVTATDKS